MLRFSIVVPVYNCENYLDECIASVLAQTYANYELILIDDGSADKSGGICDAYAHQYSEQVFVKHNQNNGPYISRLQGVDIATGDVIVFLDSDDCLRSDALYLLNQYFSMYECDMVIYDAHSSEMFPSIDIVHPFEAGMIFEGENKN